MHRRHRTARLAFALLLNAVLVAPAFADEQAFEPAPWWQAPWTLPSDSHAGAAKAEQCDDLSDFEIQVGLDYESITTEQSSENDAFNGCTSCHSAGMFPASGFSVTSPEIYATTGTGGINVPVTKTTSSLRRIVPGRARDSLLALILNCAEPDTTGPYPRMPLGGGAILLYRQALVWDWIQGGALRNSDAIFGAGFDSQR
jgi:hypothetical protein